MLILFYDTLWNAPLEMVALPPGYEITADRRQYHKANAVVFHLPQWKWQPRFFLPKKMPGQIWVAWSMECQENYPRLKDENFMRAFDLTMTYQLDADVPALYFDGQVQDIVRALREPPQPKTARAPVVAFVSSRINSSGRREYMRELMRHVEMDSYGKFLNNARLAKDRWRATKLDTIARYKFTLAFENAIARDYVTEKFFDPLLRGSVPIYLGAPNVETFAPGDKCYLNVNDFESPRALAAYVQFLARDADAYNEYFAWKQKPFRPAFRELTERYGEHPQVRLCRAVAARLSAR